MTDASVEDYPGYPGTPCQRRHLRLWRRRWRGRRSNRSRARWRRPWGSTRTCPAPPSPRAAGSLLKDDQGKLLDTLNHLTEKLGRPVML